MAQLIQQSDKALVLKRLIQVNHQSIVRMAPKAGGDPNRLLRIAYNAVAYDDRLADCLTTRDGQASIIGGIFEAIKLGVTIGGPMQEAWLIPFKIRGVSKAQLIIGYMGYRNILDRAKAVVDFQPRAVHVKDAAAGNFDYELGSNPYIRFKPQFPQPTSRDDMHCVFGIANLRGGGRQMDVLFREEVDAHRARSRAKDDGPWVTDYVPMAMKTVVRKMAKYLPKSNELLARALELDNQVDSGEEQVFDVGELEIPDDEPTKNTPSRPKALEAMKERLGVPTKPTGEKQPVARDDTGDDTGGLTADDFGFGGS